VTVVAEVAVTRVPVLRNPVPVPLSMFPEPRLFCLTVVGDSMTGDGIQSGDQIIVDPEREPADGDICVVTYALAKGGRGTVLKHVRFKDCGLLLVSSNPAYPPKLVTTDASPVIGGLVIGLARNAGGEWKYRRFPEAQ
jgi:DNA helicase II / ATP-dependent DNA helicase PcrA